MAYLERVIERGREDWRVRIAAVAAAIAAQRRGANAHQELEQTARVKRPIGAATPVRLGGVLWQENSLQYMENKI